MIILGYIFLAIYTMGFLISFAEMLIEGGKRTKMTFEMRKKENEDKYGKEKAN